MKKVLFVTKGEQSASTRYRATSYFPLLKSRGWEASHFGLNGGAHRKWLLLYYAARADVVILVRRTFSPLLLSLLRRVSKRLVFDYDDAIFLKSSGQPSVKRGRRFQRTLSRCDLVFAGNHYLKEQAQPYCDQVTLLPTSLDLSHYQKNDVSKSDFIDLVWIGSSSTRRYLESLLPALESAAKQNDRLRLKVIADFDLATDVLPVLAVPWSLENEARELRSAHIGIAPMIDNPWTRGKCALKVLQYMAAELPVISSPAGVNREVVESGVTGFLADNEEEWVNAIMQLAQDRELRQRMGNAGLLRCTEGFSQQHCADILAQSITALCAPAQ